MSKSRPSALVELIEQRLLFDASDLTETIVSSTLPASVSDHAVLKGTVSVELDNNSGIDQKIPDTVFGVVIANGQLNVDPPNFAVLRSQTSTIAIADGASKTFKFQINIPKGKLADGVDTLYAVVVDQTQANSESPAGPTLTVHPPIVTLSETEAFAKLADSTATGAKFRVSDKVTITNSGPDPSTDALTIAIFATPDGIPADGSQMTSITRKIIINSGKSVSVPVNIAAIPTLGVGTYELITQVTQSNGTVTQTDPSTAPTVTVTVPTTGPQFSDSFIGTPTTTYTPEPLQGFLQYLSTIQFEMSIKNTGNSADGDDTFNLFASASPTFDSSAVQVGGPVPLDLIIPKNGVRNFFVAFNLTKDLDTTGDEVNDYLFIQVTDPTNNVTTAGYPTLINVGGPIDPNL